MKWFHRTKYLYGFSETLLVLAKKDWGLDYNGSPRVVKKKGI